VADRIKTQIMNEIDLIAEDIKKIKETKETKKNKGTKEIEKPKVIIVIGCTNRPQVIKKLDYLNKVKTCVL
jgi:hypothetical protein